MTEQVEISPGTFVDASAIVVSFSRSSGPGGQNVNKLSTKADLRLDLHALTGVLRDTAVARLRTLARNKINKDDFLLLSSQEHRTQEMNRDAVLAKLAELIAAARIEPKVRRPTRPTKAAKRRRLDAKKHRSGIKSGRGRVGEE
ncbi:MAG TPA: alternative ribosome rescue aminoacyl-tRNA hydrolase ArfB [Tepidisphaeraceae bacterium]|nr:alternative ribosome rescue aminoacyl-tRNA hydrolase ArfB [Tepidisphaeraceae bacterium]